MAEKKVQQEAAQIDQMGGGEDKEEWGRERG